MESTKLKAPDAQKDGGEDTGKAVRISARHKEILTEGRREINKDQTYAKKISYTRYIEKLIEDHWSKPIEELKKEREGSEDWLKLEYKREAPNMEFFDWLRARYEAGKKKTSKRNNEEKE